VATLVSSSAALVFLTNMGDTPQSTAPSAIQVKNWQQTVCIEEKLDIISQLEKGELLTYAFMLVSLIVYTQFVMVLIEMLIQ